MTVFGVDPGETTGIVAGEWRSGHFEVEVADERRFRSIADEFGFYCELFAEYKPSFVVVETFQLRTNVRSANVLSPVVVRTIVACAATQIGGIAVFGYSSSTSKSTWTNARLKRKGYWISGKDHKRDALRQVLVKGAG